MATFLPIRNTKTEIDTTPIIDGQFLMTTDLVGNKTYLDNGVERLTINDGKSSYREKQSENISRAYKKLYKKENVVIDAYGDSITYGQDLTSADKRENSTTYPDGTVYTQTIASKTYPEALQEKLNIAYDNSNKITVNNKGCPGDYVQRTISRWLPNTHPTIADFSILGYGINDSRNPSCPYVGDVRVFIQQYRLFIESLINNGNALILMTPIKMRQARDVNVKSFSQAIYNLGDEYGIPILNAEEILANYGVECYSDVTHLNGKGYNILGSKIASIFIANGLINPIHVNANSTLLTRAEVDGLMYQTGCSLTSTSSYPTPSEFDSGKGIALLIGQNLSAFYSFYLEEELYIIPYLGLNTTSAEAYLLLDFGIEQPDYSNDKITNPLVAHNYTERALSEITYVYGNTDGAGKLFLKEVIEKKLSKLRVLTKGWHTLQIKAVGGSIGVGGITFKSLDDMYDTKCFTDSYKYNKGLSIETLSGSTVTIRGTISSQNGIGVVTSLTPPIQYNNSLNDMMAITNEKIKLNRAVYFTPTLSNPTAEKGMMYFDGVLNKFKVCEDGINWVNLI